MHYSFMYFMSLHLFIYLFAFIYFIYFEKQTDNIE